MAGPTNAQVQAVYEVMRLLREDGRDRGLGPDELIECGSCRRSRSAAGAVQYADAMLCNGCATDYELLRIARLAPPR